MAASVNYERHDGKWEVDLENVPLLGNTYSHRIVNWCMRVGTMLKGNWCNFLAYLHKASETDI
jgi:hypothetical protein